jgi:hypothetical protein
MPKEVVVQSEAAAPREFNAAGTPQPSGFVEARHGLSVGWNKIGWVQIHMFPHEWESTGDWTIVDLERGQINDLIRMLRKARDAAFGSDA